MSKDWKRTYADDLACRWAAQHLNVDCVERLIMDYMGAELYGCDTCGPDPSYFSVYAIVDGQRAYISVEMPAIIDGMIRLETTERENSDS